MERRIGHLLKPQPQTTGCRVESGDKFSEPGGSRDRTLGWLGSDILGP